MKTNQQQIFDNTYKDLFKTIVDKKQSVFITGPAGAGKTFLIKQLYDELKQKKKNVVLTSTTGINALNLGGITIHKLMGLQNRTDMGYIGFMKSSFLFRGITMRMTKVDYIIIDEVSMLRADTLELINEILKQCTKCDKPFGGKIIIFTGDFYQIPPVVKNWEKKKEQWLFRTPAWTNANIKVYNLEHIYRQQDKDFIELLNNIRIGKWNKQIDQQIKTCCNKQPPEGVTRFFSTNEECENYNQKCLDKIPGKEYQFLADIKGKRNHKFKHDKEAIMRDCIAKIDLRLKVGAKVIALVNDKKMRYMNGSLGEVTSCDQDNYIVSVRFYHSNEIIKIRRHTWCRLGFDGRPKARFKQIPLLPSYALTIHKSQGLTLDSATIDCKNIFACGQLYVALSRVRDSKNLYITNFHKNQILVSKEVVDFFNKAKKTA